MAFLRPFDDVARRSPHLLDDVEAQARAIDVAHRLARDRDAVFVPLVPQIGDRVSLADSQTPFKNQQDRGTCYAFATCAAMEAAYKRKYGVTLDLSEQFAFHLNKAGELYPDYVTNPAAHENNSSDWGFQGCSDLVAKLQRAAIPGEVAAPYLDQAAMDSLKAATPECGALDWNSTQEELDAFEYLPGHIPAAAREAARFRVTDCRALPQPPTVADLESVLADGHEVVADVPGHCVLLVGYNRDRQTFQVKNSWGEGHLIDVDYNSTSWPILWGWYIVDVDALDASAQQDAFWIGRWQMDHDGHRGELVIRRTTDYRRTQADATKLGTSYRDGQHFDVNGRVIQNGQGLHFWVADATTRLQPGTEQGQEFWAYVFTRSPDNAAGITRWGGVDYGVTLSRSPIVGRASQSFALGDWHADWAMNHDGWLGVLHIASVEPFRATYRAQDGNVWAVSGEPDAAQPHILRIAIGFPGGSPQPFQLFGHTWENNLFSGLTEWGGGAYGVQGHRLRPGTIPFHPPRDV